MTDRAKKVYIRTFGCQMNEYDSDKMADVLAAAEGYEKTDAVEEADLILFNTCSVREKAQEKVFADLGRLKPLKRAQAGPDDRRRRVRREPGGRGDRAPRALRGRGVRPADAPPAPGAAGGAPRNGPAPGRHLVSRRSRSSTTCRRRAWKARAPSCPSWRVAASTAASAWCPTRAARRSRGPSRTCCAELRDLAAKGVQGSHPPGPERERLRGRDGRRRDGRFRAAPRARGAHRTVSSASATRPRTRWNSPSGSSTPTGSSRSSSRRCTCRCSRARTGCSPR